MSYDVLPLTISRKGVLTLVAPTQDHLNAAIEAAGGPRKFCEFAGVPLDALFLWRPNGSHHAQLINVAVHNWGPIP